MCPKLRSLPRRAERAGARTPSNPDLPLLSTNESLSSSSVFPLSRLGFSAAQGDTALPLNRASEAPLCCLTRETYPFYLQLVSRAGTQTCLQSNDRHAKRHFL